MNNQENTQIDSQVDDQLNSREGVLIQKIEEYQNSVMLLLNKMSIKFVNLAIYILMFKEFENYHILFTCTMREFSQFINIKKTLDISNTPLPYWLSVFIHMITPNLIEYAKQINSYNNEFIDVINELESFLPNHGFWDLSNDDRNSILSTLDHHIFIDIFIKIENTIA